LGKSAEVPAGAPQPAHPRPAIRSATRSPILNELIDRFRSSRRLVGDEAASLGNEAVKVGTRVGNDALKRIATEVEHRPLVTLVVAIGVGVLIGMTGRRR
jgi:hypothetical protein